MSARREEVTLIESADNWREICLHGFVLREKRNELELKLSVTASAISKAVEFLYSAAAPIIREKHTFLKINTVGTFAVIGRENYRLAAHTVVIIIRVFCYSY